MKNKNGNKAFIPTSKNLNFFKNMPALRHKLPKEKYESSKSEVFEFMDEHRLEIFKYVFDIVRGRDGRRGQLIQFKDGQWSGVDWDENHQDRTSTNSGYEKMAKKEIAELFAMLLNDAVRTINDMHYDTQRGDHSQVEYTRYEFKKYWQEKIDDLGLTDFVSEIGLGDLMQ